MTTGVVLSPFYIKRTKLIFRSRMCIFFVCFYIDALITGLRNKTEEFRFKILNADRRNFSVSVKYNSYIIKVFDDALAIALAVALAVIVSFTAHNKHFSLTRNHLV